MEEEVDDQDTTTYRFRL